MTEETEAETASANAEFMDVDFDSPQKCMLTDEEVRKAAKHMSRMQDEIAQKEEEAKSVAARYKEELKALLAQQNKYSALVRDEYEYRTIPCIRRLDWRCNTVYERRTDTGEEIGRRPMNVAECQMRLSLEEVAKKDELKQDIPVISTGTMDVAVVAAHVKENYPEEVIEKAIKIISDLNRASTSALQRRMKIGAAQASRIMDILEERGIVGPANGDEPREVLINTDAATTPIEQG